MRRTLTILVPITVVVIVGLLWLRARPGPARPGRSLATTVRLPDFGPDVDWVNGEPMTDDSLRGRPVALVVWSDTDPASLDLLPEVEAWHDAYARYGARVIGVHAPDFSFAANPAVTAAVSRRMRLRFPIALDPGYRIRSALGVAEAPALFVADGDGAIVLTEGADGAARAERALRTLVRESRPDVVFPGGGDPAEPPGGSPSASARRFVYLGTARVRGGPLLGTTTGKAQTFTTQFLYQEEGHSLVPYPVGRWTPGVEGLTAVRGGPANFVALRTEGGSVEAVLGPPTTGPSRVWVLDGDDWLGPEARDVDVRADASGATYIDVVEPRLYAISRGGQRTIKLSPDSPGVTIYGFAIEPP